MPENPANNHSPSQPSGYVSREKHVASKPQLRVVENSTDDYSSGQPSDIPPAEQTHVASKSTVSTFLGMQANYIFQLLGLAATIVFGIWGIKVYITSQKALQQNMIANELTLLNLCVSGGTSMSIVSEACSGVSLGPALANIASVLSPNMQEVTDTSATAESEPTTLIRFEFTTLISTVTTVPQPIPRPMELPMAVLTLPPMPVSVPTQEEAPALSSPTLPPRRPPVSTHPSPTIIASLGTEKPHLPTPITPHFDSHPIMLGFQQVLRDVMTF